MGERPTASLLLGRRLGRRTLAAAAFFAAAFFAAGFAAAAFFVTGFAIVFAAGFFAGDGFFAGGFFAAGFFVFRAPAPSRSATTFVRPLASATLIAVCPSLATIEESRACGEQQRDATLVAFVRGDEQRRGAGILYDVHLRARIKQHLHAPRKAFLGGLEERTYADAPIRAAVILAAVDIGAILEEEADQAGLGGVVCVARFDDLDHPRVVPRPVVLTSAPASTSS